ncbi:MAG: hypothetical protein KKA55_01745 [Proteobacteria bacterium]|nr:hypothetical protein [Pseudomonadota bacterium]MBU1594241.1 hypothetical protein [Pseudomonadota bacterium]
MRSANPSSPLAVLEAQVRAACPDADYLAPVIAPAPHPCADMGGGSATISQCVNLVASAGKRQLKRCLACPQGQRLAATSPFHRRPRQVYASTPKPRPDLPAEDPALGTLAATLRDLTADGRVRVSLLDVMTGLGLRQYDDAMRLVRRAGLTTGRPFGSVPAIAVNHSLREFLARSEGVRA